MNISNAVYFANVELQYTNTSKHALYFVIRK